MIKYSENSITVKYKSVRVNVINNPLAQYGLFLNKYSMYEHVWCPYMPTDTTRGRV